MQSPIKLYSATQIFSNFSRIDAQASGFFAVQLRAMHRSHRACEDAAIDLHSYCSLFHSLSVFHWIIFRLTSSVRHSFDPNPLAHLLLIIGANGNCMPNYLFVQKPPCDISCCSYHIALTYKPPDIWSLCSASHCQNNDLFWCLMPTLFPVNKILDRPTFRLPFVIRKKG